MQKIHNVLSWISNSRMVARVAIAVAPWILLGVAGRIGESDGFRVTISDPIDLKIFLSLMAAYVVVAFAFTAAGEWFQDEKTVSESKQGKSYVYENMASSFFTLGGGLAFLFSSGRSNIGWGWLVFLFCICCILGVIFQKLSSKILERT